MRRVAVFVAALVAVLGITHSAHAQGAFPTKPIHLIVPFGTGSSDSLARIVGEKFSELLGQPVVVENKPGGNGVVAGQYVLSQPADGYTIQMCLNSTHGLASLFNKDVPFDPFDDFTAIGGFVSAPFVLFAYSSVPANNAAELLDYVRDNPSQNGVASGGVGSIPHLAVELLNQKTDVHFEHIPYRGGGEAMTDLVGGQVPLLFSTIGPAKGHVDAGTIKMIAVMGDERLSLLPDLPALGETVPGFEIPDALFGACGPAGIPAPVVARLNEALGEAIQSPEVAEKLANLDMNPAVMSAEKFGARLRGDYKIFKQITDAAGIEPQ
jgi:tripartite-type tricarboxylate transporter receptor subunit TctC